MPAGHRCRRRPACAALLAVAAALAGEIGSDAGVAGAASVTVSMQVASATTLDTSGCASNMSGVTAFGMVLPGGSAITGSDCALVFGSTNDTAVLRIGQADGRGRAMFSPPDGSADTSFGTIGSATASLGSVADDVYAVDVQDDGGYVVVGTTSGTSDDVAVARFTASGALDSSFGSGGVAVTDAGSLTSDHGHAVAVQPDGKILVAGSSATTAADFLLARYTSAGALDTSFGSGGIVTTSFGSGHDDAYGMALQSDGRIVLVGRTANGATFDWAAARYTVTGDLDTTFGSGGKVVTPGNGGSDYPRDVVVDTQGRIVAAGRIHDGTSTYDVGIVRYRADGSLDTSFGGSGRVLTPLGAGHDSAWGLDVYPDGRVVVAGNAQVGTTFDLAAVRYTAGGVPDTSFDGDGVLLIPRGGSSEADAQVAVQADGRLLIGSTASGGASGDDFAVYRRTEPGAADPTFDLDGVALYAPSASADVLADLIIEEDGRVVLAGVTGSGGDADAALVRLDTATVPDYAAATDGWSSGTGGFTGACLRAVDANSTALWALDADAVCDATDADPWNPIGATPSAIARTTSAGVTSATARLRFGVKVASDQPPGAYVAPATVSVVAPAA